MSLCDPIKQITFRGGLRHIRPHKIHSANVNVSRYAVDSMNEHLTECIFAIGGECVMCKTVRLFGNQVGMVQLSATRLLDKDDTTTGETKAAAFHCFICHVMFRLFRSFFSRPCNENVRNSLDRCK